MRKTANLLCLLVQTDHTKKGGDNNSDTERYPPRDDYSDLILFSIVANIFSPKTLSKQFES